MLSLGAHTIYLYQGAADMRRSFDGLSILVHNAFPGQLLTGGMFVFMNRRRNMLKVLYWDEDGLAIWSKRLERGMFKIGKNGQTKITRREFNMLLEGIEPRRLNRRFCLPS